MMAKKLERNASRKLMHAADVNGAKVRMRCKWCGYQSDWLVFRTETDKRRGIPCPACSAAASSIPAATTATN
jgi:peptide subunit release factor 1 (eRF1)